MPPLALAVSQDQVEFDVEFRYLASETSCEQAIVSQDAQTQQWGEENVMDSMPLQVRWDFNSVITIIQIFGDQVTTNIS
jgi:hypothetical protein